MNSRVILITFAVLLLGAVCVQLTTNAVSAEDTCEAEWNKTFGGSGAERGESVRQTLDGGFIILAYKYTDILWLIKTDSEGNETWNKTFAGTGDNSFYAVQQTSDEGYIIATVTGLYGSGTFDFWLIKTDSTGNELWNRTFGGPGADYAHSVDQTSDGGYVIVGDTHDFVDWDMLLVKTDSSGNPSWEKTFGGTGHDFGYSVQQTSDGGYIVAGDTESYGAGSHELWLIKTDPDGNEMWSKTFGGTGDDRGHSVQQTSDGGYIIAGYTQSYGAGSGDFWLIKTDPDGNEMWSKTFGGAESDFGRSVQQTSDGGYIMAGYTQSYGAGSGDFWLIKADSIGNEIWSKTFGGPEFDFGRSVRQTSDNGYIILGYTYSYGAGASDAWLIKVSNPPDRPANILPPDGSTGTSITPTFESSAFSDPDIGDTHTVSQWQIREAAAPSDYSFAIFDSVTDINLTSITIPSGTLNYSTAYNWHVRHQDNHGVWSGYSSETSFTTAVTPPPIAHELTISSTTGGNVTTPGEGTFSYDEGTVVSLAATPDAGYSFVDWTGDVDTIANINGATTTITMLNNYSITANFSYSRPCFIATATYGTPVARETQILRDFRDEYLLSNPLGQAFVALYYNISPPIAEFITEHPNLKLIVRAGLLPVVIMSRVAVNTTPVEKAAIPVLLIVVLSISTIWVVRPRGRGPQYT